MVLQVWWIKSKKLISAIAGGQLACRGRMAPALRTTALAANAKMGLVLMGLLLLLHKEQRIGDPVPRAGDFIATSRGQLAGV